MSSHVLGISCFYHDAAAALVSGGHIVAAAQEERFSRQKHDPGYPARAIEYCLGNSEITPDELDAVVFYENPVLSLDRNLAVFMAAAPGGIERWREFADAFLGRKLLVAREIRRRLGTSAPIRVTRHHLSHAASAFYPSPFREAAILTIDGVGEWETTAIAFGAGSEITPLKSIHFPHSLGLLYSAFTHHCGFRVNSGEYKLMGLAPFGNPRFADLIREKLIHFAPDGSYRLNIDYFDLLNGDRFTNARFDALFGGQARIPGSRITDRESDLAASIQTVTEEAVLGLARQARELTGARNLCMAGGVALNCVANGRLRREAGFDRIWIQPAAGDAGGALGAALLGAHLYLDEPRIVSKENWDGMRGSLLGPDVDASWLGSRLSNSGCACEVIPDRIQRAKYIARRVDAGDVVGLCSGRMEFGPRALGSRSIIADPRDPTTQSRLNLKVKFRESFRPFAPAVMEEATSRVFEFEGASPYMLFTAPVRAERRKPTEYTPGGGGDLLEVVNRVRSDLPAITHVDYSARLQTVGPEANADFRAILEAFFELTSCPVLVNTSFNLRGEPIVCTSEDAWQCFCKSEIDTLVVGDLVIFGKPEGMPKGEALKDDDFAPAGAELSDSPRVDLFHRLMLSPAAKASAASCEARFGAVSEGGSTWSEPDDTDPFLELETLEAIGTALKAIWDRDGLGHASKIIGPLLELSEELADQNAGAELGPVTPHIYTLF